MVPSRDFRETAEALALVTSPAQALIDTGAIHSDHEAKAAGALILYAWAAGREGAWIALLKREKEVARVRAA